MNADITFKENVMVDTVLAALGPVSAYCGWSQDDVMNNRLQDEDTIEMAVNDGIVHRMTIYTRGPAHDGYKDALKQFANNLSEIAIPGSIAFRDLDANDPDDATTVIWYGGAGGIRNAKLLAAWTKAADLLRDAGISDADLRTMATSGGIPQAAPF